MYVICAFVSGYDVCSHAGVHSTEGNEFYMIMPPNKGGKVDPEIYVSTTEESVNFFVSWSYKGNITKRFYTAIRRQFTRVKIPGYLEIQPKSPYSPDLSVTVKAEMNKTITVYGLTEEYASTDSWLALPKVTNKLGKYEYFAVSTKRSIVPTVLDVYSFMGIVVTEDNTTIEITPRRNLLTRFGRNAHLKAGQTYTGLFPKGHTIAMSSANDITGSRVVANKPLTVMSGHQCGTVPHNHSACDVMVEQIPSTDTWGFTFILVPLSVRLENGFSFTASHPGTVITIKCNNRKGKRNHYQVIRLVRPGDHKLVIYPTKRYCWVKSNLPILVMQYALGHSVDLHRLSNTQSDPFMVTIPPIEQYSNEFNAYFFESIDKSTATLNIQFSPWINLMITAEYYSMDSIHSSREAFVLNSTTFTPIQCEDGEICAYAAQLKPTTTKGPYSLSHMNPKAKCSATVYGWERENTYGCSAGFQLASVAGTHVHIHECTFNVNYIKYISTTSKHTTTYFIPNRESSCTA